MNNQETIIKLRKIINLEKINDEQTLDFPIAFIFHHVLERIENNLVSLDLLMKDSLIRHHHTIGLISRNLLNDFIVTGFIILESKNEDELISKLYSHLYSDLKKMDTYAKTQKDFNSLSNDEYDTIKKKYSDENTIYSVIRKFGSEINQFKFPPNSLIFQTFLKSENQNIWRKHIIDAYDLWLYFSKYEHMGIFSYDFTREIKKDKIEHQINFVLLCTTLMVASCFELLKNEVALSESIDLYKNIYCNQEVEELK